MSNQPFTPDGNKYNPRSPLSISECWLTSTDYPKLKAYADSPVTGPFVDQYIIDACAMINSMTGRYLNYQLQDQIFPNTPLFVRDYTVFALNSLPIVSIQNVWLEVAQTFAPVQQDYFQLDTYTGLIKVLPNFSIYTSIPVAIPLVRQSSSANLWIRYYAGYTRTTVPADLKRATALAVDYLFGLDNITPNLKRFETQTYSESVASMDDDPLLNRIKKMVEPYTLITVSSYL